MWSLKAKINQEGEIEIAVNNTATTYLLPKEEPSLELDGEKIDFIVEGETLYAITDARVRFIYDDATGVLEIEEVDQMAKYLIGNIKGPKGDRGEAGPTYTAGNGIDITNNVISATGSGGITTETDPVFSASPAAGITAQDITDWNAKSDFSGSYNDLTNKPDLSVYATNTALGTGLARKQDTLTAGTNITIDANNVISAAAAEDELPTIASGDAGKVLTVNSGETGVEWTTVSGGGGSSETLTITSKNATQLAPVASSIVNAAGDYSKVIREINYYGLKYILGDVEFDLGATNVSVKYYAIEPTIVRYGNNKFARIKVYTLTFKVNKNTGEITNLVDDTNTSVQSGYPLLSNNMISTGLIADSNGNIKVNTNVIAQKTDVPTAQANAATALYLKDSNNQVYEITVDTNGTLTATAVSNS